MSRRNPYGIAMTIEDYHEIEHTLTRPLTGDPIRRRSHRDEILSRLVQPQPRKTGAQRPAEHRARKAQENAA